MPPPVVVEVAPPRNFAELRGLQRVTYSRAGSFDGTDVFGRGVSLVVSITNVTEELVTDAALYVIARRLPRTPPALRYDKAALTVPNARLPFDDRGVRVRLTEAAIAGTRIAGRRTGGPLAPHAARKVHLTIEASTAGLWQCDVAVSCDSGELDPVGPYFVLLRGK